MADGLQLGEDNAVRSTVSKYYGETLQSSSDLKTSACCTAKPPPREVLDILRQVPAEITSRYYGCGSPFPVGLKDSGLRVLDLGCGTGRDCYVCAGLVGAKGFVTGVDMTDAQLEFANKHSAAWQQHLGYAQPNMRFVKGAIEQLEAAGIAAGSVDIIISNCVINLSPDKPAVLREAFRALAPGGEVFFSDVYCDRRLAPEVRRHEVLLGECLGGALHINDFLRLSHEVGFTDPRVLEAAPIAVHDPQLSGLLGEARFFSVTFRLFKLPGQVEALPQEDYGQQVTYNGTLPGAPEAYVLDCNHTFKKGVSVRVSGNTAAMCSSSWFAPHFTVTGDKGQHLGQFTGAGSADTDAVSIAALSNTSSAAAGGSCGPGACGTSSACCPPPTTSNAAADAGAGTKASTCCGPAADKAPKAGPSKCCGPKAASSCCPAAPAVATSVGNKGCCAAPAAPTGGGCCAPNKPGVSSSSCCAGPPPGDVSVPAAAAPVSKTGCCVAPKEQSSAASGTAGGGCCKPKACGGWWVLLATVLHLS